MGIDITKGSNFKMINYINSKSMYRNKQLGVIFLFLFSLNVFSQKTAFYLDPEEQYKTGIDLFDKKQYVSAQKAFDNTLQNSKNEILKADAEYYAAACAIELFHKDGEWRMKEFLRKHPENVKNDQANFYLGKSNYRKKHYESTIEFLDKVDLFHLEADDKAELRFKRGYSFYMINNNEKAKADLTEIKDVDNKYMNPALYYFSHIAYTEKNYHTALEGFNKLVNNEVFGSVVPYYITQIFFIQNKFQMVVETAPSLLNDSNYVQKADEINRMIGESYYNLKDYSNALTYLKKTNLSSSSNPQGNYALGYCYYKMNDLANAVKQFEKATIPKDSISQSAWYHMADCFVRMNEKLKAKNAFYSAYTLNFDKKIVEDALFSFAKICYELDFSPYNEAVKVFTQYLKEYPNSPRKDECYAFLVNVYSTTKNYDKAIKSIESMDKIDPILEYTYQKLNYFKGVELFNNQKHVEAEKQFKKVIAMNSDLKLDALSQYWLGEIYFDRKDYSTAIKTWKDFQTMEGSIALPEYVNSNYNIAYAFYNRREKGDYTEANISFRKYLLSKDLKDDNKKADANLRAADCYFMDRNYALAIELYTEAIKLNKLDIDYTYFQRAICYGLAKKYEEKISDLKKIESNYSGSLYIGKVLNQIADTYYENQKDETNAIIYYNKILKDYNNSVSVQNCYAKLGNIYFGKKEDEKALDYFDKFLRNDSKSEEAKNIMEQVKTIFKEKGQIAEMETYFSKLGNPLSINQIELATYEDAQNAYYNKKDYNEAITKWEAYINRFGGGKYILEAQFCYGECAYFLKQFDKALKAYEFVLSKNRSLYSETALSKLSYLYFNNKTYDKALPYFIELKDIAENKTNKTNARFGIMRSAFYTNKYDTALQACNDILSNEKIYPQQRNEVNYIKAKCLYETGSLNDAMTAFKNMIKTSKNLTGAEAYYYVALIQFNKKEYKEVEKTVNKLISYEYSNDEWNNKGMLLLADAYIANGEEADAEVILLTIIESKTIQEFVDQANEKLKALKAKQEAEKGASDSQKPVNEMNIEFKENNNDKNLFDNNEPGNEEPNPDKETKGGDND
ncbi:MAG: tetratricopeptide repeat protein [Bacteroidia bacterium]